MLLLRTRRLLVLGAVLAAAGCATGPDPQFEDRPDPVGLTTATPPAPVLEEPPYAPPPPRGSLAADAGFVDAAAARVSAALAGTEAPASMDGSVRDPVLRADAPAVLFAGDVGESRAVVAVAPVERRCVAEPPTSCGRRILVPVVLTGSAGAAVDALTVVPQSPVEEGRGDQALAVVRPDGGVDVALFPSYEPQPGDLEVGVVPLDRDAYAWSAPQDRGGWWLASATDVRPDAVVFRTRNVPCGDALSTRPAPHPAAVAPVGGPECWDRAASAAG